MIITSRTRTVELFRLMYETECGVAPMKPDQWSPLQRAAHEEWDYRLEACRAEHGSCYDRERRYEGYCAGREDEQKVRGEDLRIAKVLHGAIENALAFDTLADVRSALRSLSASDLIRLRAKE